MKKTLKTKRSQKALEEDIKKLPKQKVDMELQAMQKIQPILEDLPEVGSISGLYVKDLEKKKEAIKAALHN